MPNRVIAGTDGYTIGARVNGCTMNGLWFAGNVGTNEKLQSIQAGSNSVIQNCVFINMPEALDGLIENTLIKDCVFINCGWGTLQHSIYYNNYAAIQRHTLQDCVFIGGQAYHIQLWHYPLNITIQRCFSAESEWSIVLNGDGHIAQNNFIWSGLGKAGNAQLTWNFSPGTYQYVNNFAGENVKSSGTIPETATVDGNTFYATPFTFGTSPISKTWTDFATKTTYTKAQIDDAVTALLAASALTPAQLVTDTTIATNVAIIKDMMSKLLA